MKLTMKQIAQRIRQDYAAGRCSYPDHLTIQFNIDGLIVRCSNCQASVDTVARKFERGLPRGGKTMAWPLRPRRLTTQPVTPDWEPGPFAA